MVLIFDKNFPYSKLAKDVSWSWYVEQPDSDTHDFTYSKIISRISDHVPCVANLNKPNGDTDSLSYICARLTHKRASSTHYSVMASEITCYVIVCSIACLKENVTSLPLRDKRLMTPSVEGSLQRSTIVFVVEINLIDNVPLSLSHRSWWCMG